MRMTGRCLHSAWSAQLECDETRLRHDMKRYLLIGAGFSYNWGGWLASEAFEFLLGDPAVLASAELRALLWQHQPKGGFEAALNELERGASSHHRSLASLLRAAVKRMFDTMNAAFKSKGLEFKAPFGSDHPVRNFLRSFDAIFSLNQDLLLEHCYRGYKDGPVNRDDVRTERDWEFPGMRLLELPCEIAVHPSALRTWIPTDDRAIPQDEQPIFKLHGSSNWRTAEDSAMMIIGGGKAEAIQRYPVLRWYAEVFAERLNEPDARLMIIGYGFRDEHINAVLHKSIEGGLKVFVIDPLGTEIGSVTNPLPRDALGYAPTALQLSLEKALIGASRRPLSSTLGKDDVERQKIERFFSGDAAQ